MTRPTPPRALAGAGILLLLLGTPFAVRPLVDNYSPWSTLAAAWPGDAPVDGAVWFRTVRLGEVRFQLSGWVGWNADGLRLNYHILPLRGGTEVAIPWSAIAPRRERIGIAEWVVLDVGPDAPLVWIQPGLADRLERETGGRFQAPD